MTKDIKQERKAELKGALKLLLTVILAFAAALTFRRSVGILAMIPVAYVICIGAAFIDLRPAVKNTVFAVMTFIMNTVEQKDLTVTFVYTALCLLACILSNACVAEYKKNKLRASLLSSASLGLCIALSIGLIGNPISAISADKELNEYTDKKYPANENGALGNFEFSDIYYDFRTGAYNIEAVSDRFPTEGGTITANDGSVRDSFEAIMEEKICEPYVLEITSILRDSFPDDNFSVRYDEIARKDGEAPLSKGEGELHGSISFEIYLGGIQSATQMRTRVEKYLRSLDRSGIEYSRVIFKSGTGQWIRRSVTIDGNRRENDFDFEIDYVPAGAPNSFNRFVSQTLLTD